MLRTLSKNSTRHWILVVVFAAAMAWVEAAVVVYLRTLIGRIEPYQPDPLPLAAGLSQIELGREVATMIMLLTVGALAGTTWRSRFGYTLVAFGVWDILYYVFLVPMCGWPHSVFDWDILFLLPLPWWGPVLAPVLIATLMVGYGTVTSQFDSSRRSWWPGWRTGGPALLGILLALYAFMANSLAATSGGIDAIRNTLPTFFQWPVFLVAVALMAVPLIDTCRQLVSTSRSQTPARTA